MSLTGSATNVFAQCYSQTTVILGADCKVTVLPTANTGVSISNLWAPVSLYNSYAAW